MARPVFYTPIKRNHLVAPFGVGSVLLSRNGVSVIVCGLNEWSESRPDTIRGADWWLETNQIVDGYLQARLGVTRLIQPPAVADDPDYRNTWYVRVARFPRWEYCINPKCRRMVRRDETDVANGRCTSCKEVAKKRQWPTQQIPLVLACPNDHASDVPWAEWVHTAALQLAGDDERADAAYGAPELCSSPDLTYRVSTDVAAPTVECANCKARIDLTKVRGRKHGCPGGRPWIVGSPDSPCDRRATLLERTSTNLYFARVRSALHIPTGANLNHRLSALLDEPVARNILDDYGPGEEVSERDLARLERIAAKRGVATTTAEIAGHLAATNEAEQLADTDERERELDALLDPSRIATSSSLGLPPLVAEPLNIDDFAGPYFAGERRFSAAVAVPRLAETRALAGFSRIEPPSPDLDDAFEHMWGIERPDDHGRDWLPAHRVYGEGFLLLLDADRVAKWIAATGTYGPWQRDVRNGDGRTDIHQRRLLAHTLSHALIREAAAVCGYSLPSLRERLYVDSPVGRDRTAVLIYTAEGDAYGTLGGLVELAEPGRLEALVERAITRAQWCGADPVCMAPPEGAALETSPGSCHHCLLVPETTCENFNDDLDRATLVGVRAGTIGFFTG